jgi:hypothetical protein
MDIEELKKARNEAENEILKLVQSVMDSFKEKSGLQINNVDIEISNYEVKESEVMDRDDFVQSVTCNVKW